MTNKRKWMLGGGIFAAFVIAVNIAPNAPETPKTFRPPRPSPVAIVTPAPSRAPVPVKPTETPIDIKPNPDAGRRLLERKYNEKPSGTFRTPNGHTGSSNGPTYGNNFAEPSVREFGNQSGLSWVDRYTFEDAKSMPKTWTEIQNNVK